MEFTVELAGRYMLETIGKNKEKIVQLSLKEGLEAYVTAILTWGENRLSLFRFVNRAGAPGKGKHFKEIKLSIDFQLKGVLRDILAKAQREGEIKKDINLDTLVDLIYVLTMVYMETILFPEQDEYCLLSHRKKSQRGEIFNDLMKILMKGIAPAKVVEE